MKISEIEVVSNRKPVPLPEPWRPAWTEPETADLPSVDFAFYEVHTDEGLIGLGPCWQRNRRLEESLLGSDPFYVKRLWDTHMRGRGTSVGTVTTGGLEVALWDIIGKAAGLPVYKLLGAYRDRVPAYAATAQLKSAEELVQTALDFQARGILAMKLRLHRPDPAEDVAVVRAVREAVGPHMQIMVDANQNNPSGSYRFWDRRTAMRVARELDELDVYWLEEPLPRSDVEGLRQIAETVDMYIAGAEHAASVYEFRDALFAGAYDVVQPDLVLGHIGITGLCQVGIIADSVGRLVAPHVIGGGNNGFYLAATLQALGTLTNAPYLEYTLHPPALTPDVLQLPLKNKLLIEEDGYVTIPNRPGIGIEIDEEAIREYL